MDLNQVFFFKILFPMTIAMAWPKVKLVLNDLKKNSHMDPVIDLENLITGNSQRVKNFDFAYF